MKGTAVKGKISNVVYLMQFRNDLLVCATPIYEDSFKAILEQSGRKYQVAKMLDQRLRYLCSHSHSECCRPGWIEKLSYEKNMYSMKIKLLQPILDHMEEMFENGIQTD